MKMDTDKITVKANVHISVECATENSAPYPEQRKSFPRSHTELHIHYQVGFSVLLEN